MSPIQNWIPEHKGGVMEKCIYCDRKADGVDGKCWFHSEDDTVSAAELWAEYCLNGQGNWVDPDAACQDDTPPGWGEEGGL